MIKIAYLCLVFIFLHMGSAEDSGHDSDLSDVTPITVNFTWPKDYGTCFDPVFAYNASDSVIGKGSRFKEFP